ncbi:hypothetical protein BDV98DRAFT_585386 [Pterulicium gracile]|uniref:Uncharacterized protein n=1 Tax=Pterulicium gracile TaxID=1884261 RepID=A0A5C3QBQ6_9AGAR|nr:hypothetical protein BDV98DRAFT_585386 [Pterula gracilis]
MNVRGRLKRSTSSLSMSETVIRHARNQKTERLYRCENSEYTVSGGEMDLCFPRERDTGIIRRVLREHRNSEVWRMTGAQVNVGEDPILQLGKLEKDGLDDTHIMTAHEDERYFQLRPFCLARVGGHEENKQPNPKQNIAAEKNIAGVQR